MIDFNEDIHELQEHIIEAKNKYIAILEENIKQNPDIKVLNNKCFVIKFSNLSDDSVLSPGYYDFILQRDILIAVIKQLNLFQLPKYFDHIITKGNLPSSPLIKDGDRILYEGGYNFRFHPKVIETLKKLLGDYFYD